MGQKGKPGKSTSFNQEYSNLIWYSYYLSLVLVWLSRCYEAQKFCLSWEVVKIEIVQVSFSSYSVGAKWNRKPLVKFILQKRIKWLRADALRAGHFLRGTKLHLFPFFSPKPL